ncbi:MAG: hypothetical protein JO187_08275 [Acidobacteria bacterium]|nr:hypothetical protein [Acidobacteriaceae bacterium]MBV9609540.1 hypothetical protein [Acidobacteriota bacterium]
MFWSVVVPVEDPVVDPVEFVDEDPVEEPVLEPDMPLVLVESVVVVLLWFLWCFLLWCFLPLVVVVSVLVPVFEVELAPEGDWLDMFELLD